MKTQRGFTLVELLAAMAIIAILVGLSVFGIGAAQRSARNAQRRNSANDINLAVQSFYEQNGRYPTATEVVFNSCSAAPTSSSVTVNNGATLFTTVPLSGAAGCGSTTAATDSTSAATTYLYKAAVPYTICVKMEVAAGAQTWFKQGVDTSATGVCP